MENEPGPEANEEILLFSPDTADQVPDESSLQNVSYKFQQADRDNLNSKHFCIYDNQFLSITELMYKKKRQYWLNLAYINTRPVSKLRAKWFYFWLALFFFTCSALAWLTPIVSHIPEVAHYKLSITIICGTLSAIALIALARYSRRFIQFTSINGRVALVELFNKNPDKKSFQLFLKALIERCQLAQSKNYYEPAQQLAAELNEHRRLRDQGIISAEQYNSAKNSILALHSKT